MAKDPAVLKIVNRATGAVWEVVEGSPAHKRCAAQPKAYEISLPAQEEKSTKKVRTDG